ncbi:Nnf1-domain-containing protein [Xylariomycetidae sp. FL0641]|nr:Nnf1-domain-containing protein [Xylariomycetidae sp. FL0641]
MSGEPAAAPAPTEPDTMDSEPTSQQQQQTSETASSSTTAPAQQQQQQQQQQPSSDEPQDEQQPASPPLPARHTAQTPGPRASKFQAILAKTLKHTLDKIDWDNFAACYPTVAAKAPGTLRAVQKQMVDRLGALCQKEFESIMQARSVVAKLNELESLVSEAERRRDEAGEGGVPPIPPHMLPADAVLAAHLAPHLTSQQSQLNAKLQTTQAHNAKLFDEIRRQRAEIESLVGLLEKAFEDVDGANQMMDDVVDDMAKETRTVEVEMAGL